MEEMGKSGELGRAALKSGMHRHTGTKDASLGLPRLYMGAITGLRHRDAPASSNPTASGMIGALPTARSGHLRARVGAGSGPSRGSEHVRARRSTSALILHPTGFIRLQCSACRIDRVVPFSCKGRLCISCSARRMADTAAHLVDRVHACLPYARAGARWLPSWLHHHQQGYRPVWAVLHEDKPTTIVFMRPTFFSHQRDAFWLPAARRGCASQLRLQQRPR